ncbi:MAG: hypothetical protein CVV17_04365 [Gammaproteobacteria bacterium HGW-Gammaproteobacteria-7]|nr:MAG: hypothetical protein CVV17_04365 [Gammaproteobacteria bacterium HGW-Gammaproteobacteria-7]
MFGSLLLMSLPMTQTRAFDAEAAPRHTRIDAAAPEVREEGSDRRQAQRDCLRESGSRIKRARSERCIQPPGSVYSREHLDRTGQTDVGHALERLDPRIRVR